MNVVPTSKVTDFIRSLDEIPLGKVTQAIDLLEEFGSQLRMPHSKHISQNLFELRVKGKQEIRIFYCFGNNNAYLLHGFIKKSQKAPLQEINQAQRVKSSLDI